MKKIIALFTAFVFAFSSYGVVYADFPASWSSTSTTANTIKPTKINNVDPKVQFSYFYSSSPTATSTVYNPLQIGGSSYSSVGIGTPPDPAINLFIRGSNQGGSNTSILVQNDSSSPAGRATVEAITDVDLRLQAFSPFSSTPNRVALISDDAQMIDFIIGGAWPYHFYSGGVLRATLDENSNFSAGTVNATSTGNATSTIAANATVGGKLGVGTTNPTQRLDVNGGLRVRGFSGGAANLEIGADNTGSITGTQDTVSGTWLTGIDLSNKILVGSYDGNDGIYKNGTGVGTAKWGIGTSTPSDPYQLSVAGGIYSTASSSFNGINLTGGCFAISGTCITGSGSGGITSLNGLTVDTQTFATGTDTNVKLAVVSSGSTHTFTPSWSGTLAPARGGLGGDFSSANGWVNASAGTFTASTSPTVNWLTATSTTRASTLPYASSTSLTVSDTAYIGTLNGPLQANNGKVSATTSVGVLYGGLGLTTAPSYGLIPVGNASGGYTLTSTSSLNISGGSGSGTVNSGSLGQTPYYAANGTTLSPTSLLVVDDGSISGSQRVGVGISTGPQTRFHVSVDDVAAATNLYSSTSDSLLLTNSGNSYMRATASTNTASNSGGLFMLRSRGTIDSPSDVADADTLGVVTMQGWASSNRRNAVRMIGTVDGAVSGSVVKGKMQLQTANSSGTLTTGLTMLSNQNVGIGNVSTPQDVLEVGGNAIVDNKLSASYLAATSSNATSTISGDFSFNGSNRNLYMKVGSNNSVGTTTLSSGTATVNNTLVKADSIIMLTIQACTNCGFMRVGTITPGTSFTIVSSNVLTGTDATVAWQIIQPVY